MTRALVVTASTRAAQGVYEDRSGPVIAERLIALGFEVDGPRVVADGPPVRDALRFAVAARYDVVVTTGGTGLSPTDATPEMTREVITLEVPGIAEALRAGSFPRVPTSILSRGIAGVAVSGDGARRTFVANLPGSRGGASDGMDVLERVLPHIVEQLAGADHGGPAVPGAPSWSPS